MIKQWEYKTVQSLDNIDLSLYSKWELVSVIRYYDFFIFYFKREINENIETKECPQCFGWGYVLHSKITNRNIPCLYCEGTGRISV